MYLVCKIRSNNAVISTTLLLSMPQVQFVQVKYRFFLLNNFYFSVSNTSSVFSLVSQPLTILLRKLKCGAGLGISFFITRHTKFFARFYGKLQRQHFDKSYFDGPFHKLYLLVEAPSALGGPKAQTKCKRKETSLLLLVLYYVDVPQYGRQRMPKKAQGISYCRKIHYSYENDRDRMI